MSESEERCSDSFAAVAITNNQSQPCNMNSLCNCKNCTTVVNDLDSCLKVYKTYEWLISSYVLDYFTEDHWTRLPKCWQTYFEVTEVEEMADFLNTDIPLNRMKTVCPLSILALRQVFKNSTVSRKPKSILCYRSISKQHKIFKVDEDHIKPQPPQFKLPINHTEKLKFRKNAWRHMSPKKRYEISYMAEMSARIAYIEKCGVIVDIGAGLGHLSRILAYGYGLRVCCLEAQERLTEQAKRLDMQFDVMAKKCLTPDVISRLFMPAHINITLDDSTDLEELVQRIAEALGITNLNFKFGVIGLHPCGDLAPFLIKLFKKSDNVKFINVASCCYMKLSTGKTENPGYPLSTYVKSLDCELSYAARELCCHAIEMFISKLTDGYVSLKTHTYRAALEVIIMKYWPEKKHLGLRNVKCTVDLSFEEYCKRATHQMDMTIPYEDIYSNETISRLFQWKSVTKLYSIRLMFAPMLETIILLDRFLYTADKDIKCTLFPIFDPKSSPRNHILIAKKT